MPSILYHQAGAVSAPILAAHMGIRPLRACHKNLPPPNGPLIRWGSGRVYPTDLEINPRSALIAYQNRLQQLVLLRNAEVRVPNFSQSFGAAKWYDGEMTLLTRTFPKGRQNSHGRDITICPSGYDKWGDTLENIPNNHDMVMEFIPKHRQFRVHVVGETTRTRELIPTNGCPFGGNGTDECGNGSETYDDGDDECAHQCLSDYEMKQNPIWNLSTGFTYRVVNGLRPVGVIPQAKAAVKALGLHFGAVDVITDIDDTAYVLEVNTAPGLGPLTVVWYARYLAPLVGINPLQMPGVEV